MGFFNGKLIAFYHLCILSISLMLPGCYFDDAYFTASKLTEGSWPSSTPVSVVIDSFGGGIWVRPSQDGVVRAIVTSSSTCKNLSYADAETSLRDIDVEMVKDGDKIRIMTRQAGHRNIDSMQETSVELYVPDGSRLNLRTDVGSICVSGLPLQIKAENRIGVMLFELQAAHTPANLLAPAGVRLESGGGSVEVNLDQRAYRLSGPLRATPLK